MRLTYTYYTIAGSCIAIALSFFSLTSSVHATEIPAVIAIEGDPTDPPDPEPPKKKKGSGGGYFYESAPTWSLGATTTPPQAPTLPDPLTIWQTPVQIAPPPVAPPVAPVREEQEVPVLKEQEQPPLPEPIVQQSDEQRIQAIEETPPLILSIEVQFTTIEVNEVEGTLSPLL